MDSCVNRRGRHRHASHRRGPDCARPVPDYPLIHRATGQAAVCAVTAVGVLIVAGYAAVDYVATQGPLVVELARSVRLRRIR